MLDYACAMYKVLGKNQANANQFSSKICCLMLYWISQYEPMLDLLNYFVLNLLKSIEYQPTYYK